MLEINSEVSAELALQTTASNQVQALSTDHCAVEGALDALLGWAADMFGEDELIAAKEEFFWKTGKVFYDDPFYNTRMIYFQDFFLFQRAISGSSQDYRHRTPYEVYCQRKGILQPPVITGVLHSLFQVAKCQPDMIVLVDLLDYGTKYEVKLRAQQSFCAIGKKDVFQGFLYACGPDTVLSYGTVFHPREAVVVLKRQIKNLVSQPDFDQLRHLSQWAHQQVRHLRHLHVDPKRIYEDILK